MSDAGIKYVYVIIGTKRQLAKTYISTIRVGNADIVASSHVGNLGAWFDESFSMETHISKTCGVAFIISTKYGELGNIFHKILQKLIFTPL